MKNKIDLLEKCKKFIIHLLNKLPKPLQKIGTQFFLYALMGVVAFSVDYLVYLVLVFAGIYYIIAALIAAIFSSITNFLLNKNITFKNKEKQIVLQFSLYILVLLTSIAVNTSLMYLFVEVLLPNIGISRIIAKIITRPIVIVLMLPLNFGLNKYIVYNTKIYEIIKNKKKN